MDEEEEAKGCESARLGERSEPFPAPACLPALFLVFGTDSQGAWMQKQRDDKAVRRVPASVASALAAAAANKDGPDMGEMKKRSADELD